MSTLPYWRLSAFYFFYFALLGTWLPYWSLYLKSLDYSSAEIGFLSALVMVTKVLAPNIWGWLADTYHCRTSLIRAGSFFATISFLGVYLGEGLWWLALVVVLYSFFWNAVLSQFDVLTLSHLEGRYARYSLIRVWGSVGFIVAVMAAGVWLDNHPIAHMLFMISLLLTGIWLASLMVSEKRPLDGVRKPGGEGMLLILRRPAVIVFFASSLLLQASHGPYYTFFTIYMESVGYSKTISAAYWALGVFAEVMLFLVMHRLLAKVSLRQMLLWSLGLSALRWLMIAWFVDSPVVLFLAQCLHAASFGSFHAAAVETVRRWFVSCHGQGMAFYSGLSYGAGGALGAYYSGALWDVSPEWCFLLAALAAGLGWLMCAVYYEEPVAQ